MKTEKQKREELEAQLSEARGNRYRCLYCGDPILQCEMKDHLPEVSFEAFVAVLARNGTADFSRADQAAILVMARSAGVDLRDTIEIALERKQP